MNIKKIMVCINDEPESHKALEEIAPHARKLGAEVILTHVGRLYEALPDIDNASQKIVSAYDEYLQRYSSEVRDKLGELRERFSGQGFEVSVSLVPGDPANAIPDAEEQLEADLIVVGSHGRTGFRRLLAGSVSERIARRSTKLVLVARNEPGRNPYRRVLVATDFSPASERALHAALQLADSGADITLFHAWQIPMSAAESDPYLGQLITDVEALAHEQMDALARRNEGDFVLRKEVVSGHPASMIRERAAECDLVAVGSHGRRGLSRIMLGSIAELTVRHSPCSVLVAHADDTD